MDDNPYRSPMTDSGAVGVNSGSREDLRRVASYQKGILVCILIYLIAMFGQFALPPVFLVFLTIGVGIVGLAGTVFVFLLAMKVYSTGVGILLGVLALVPCLGLLILLMVNGKATAVLRENGIRVGLLGADLSQV